MSIGRDFPMYLQTMYMQITEGGKMSHTEALREEVALSIKHCAGWNSRMAARRITMFFERELGPSGVSLAQFGLMAAIVAAPDNTLGGLAQKTALDQSTLSRNLRTLEGEGLVAIGTVEGDLRRRTVSLTDAGTARLEAALPYWRAAHAKLARVVSPEAVRQIARDTERLLSD